MRENMGLYRGKRKDNGEWVEGSLFSGFGKTYICPEAIAMYYYEGALCLGGFVEVDPETVGQFTGLTDKNGKKIFEGDIVQFYGTYALEVYIENGHTKIRWFDTVTNSKCTDMFFGDDEGLGESEVIGTIHDNPELLEVSQ